VEGWVDLVTAVKVCNPCPRLYVAAAVAINTTACSVIRSWVISHRSRTCWPQYLVTVIHLKLETHTATTFSSAETQSVILLLFYRRNSFITLLSGLFFQFLGGFRISNVTKFVASVLYYVVAHVMDGRRWTCCEQRCSKLTFSTVSNWVSSSFYLPSNKTVCSSTPIQFNKTVTHTHTRLTALCPGLPGWAGTRKLKPVWI